MYTFNSTSGLSYRAPIRLTACRAISATRHGIVEFKCLRQQASLAPLVVAKPRPVVTCLVEFVQHAARLLAAHIATLIGQEAIRRDISSGESVFAESDLGFSADIVTLIVAFAVGLATPIVRDRVQSWGTQYINRFIRRGLRRNATSCAFWLAGILFASALALIELRGLLPAFVQGAILGSAITAAVALSVMGWQARGPSQPNAMTFARIFYEPATVVLTPLIMRRLPTIIDTVPGIWQQIAEISLRLVG